MKFIPMTYVRYITVRAKIILKKVCRGMDTVYRSLFQYQNYIKIIE